MAPPQTHALIFSLLILTTTSVLTTNAASSTTAPSPAPSPTHHGGHHHQHHQHHSQSPTPAPAKAPTTYHSTPPPAKAPHTPPPAKSPSPAPAYHPLPRKFIAIQGVVYCKNCTYAGVDTLVGASPLQGAMVQVKCRNTQKYELIGKATTDKNGYFYLEGPRQITTYGAHKCRAYLAQNPNQGGACGKPTNLNGGVSGGFLILSDKSKYSDQSKNNSSDFFVYNVGPFAYEPIKCNKH